MKIDGIELLRMFEKGEVNNKTKIKCIDWVTDSWTEVHFNQKGILKWDVSNIALTQEHLKHHFEIIEEDKELVFIPIEEFNISYNLGFIDYRNIEVLKEYLNKDFQNIYDTVDLLIKNQKKLIDELNKLKG